MLNLFQVILIEVEVGVVRAMVGPVAGLSSYVVISTSFPRGPSSDVEEAKAAT